MIKFDEIRKALAAYQAADRAYLACPPEAAAEVRKALRHERDAARIKYVALLDEAVATPKTPEEARELMKYLAL